MNFTTQAAQDILGKLERDPAEVRHWRQLLILCFDQKSIETLQTLQVILAAIEQIWTVRRQKAKDAYEEAKQKQRSTGSKEPLPASTVHSITLNPRQKENFIKLGAGTAGRETAEPVWAISGGGFWRAAIGPRDLRAGAVAGLR